jgi:phosphate transport system permease protein
MYLARSRARGMERAAMSGGDGSARLHSRPVYHGMYVALLTIVPALIVIVLWAVLEPVYLASLIRSALPSDVQALPGTEQSSGWV